MRFVQWSLLATLFVLCLSSGAVLAAPPTQTIPDPTPIPTPMPAPTVTTISSSPPVEDIPVKDGTLPVGEAPLSLAQRASSENATPGSEIRYTIQIASSRAGAIIETQSLLPAQLRLIGASISGGTCNGSGAIVCRTTLSQSGGATIEIVAQVIQNAPVGSTLVSQTLAQDELSYTAASDQTSVTIIAAPGGQTSSSEIAQPAQPAIPNKPAQPATSDKPAQSAQPAVAAVSPQTEPAVQPTAVSQIAPDQRDTRNVPMSMPIDQQPVADPQSQPAPEQRQIPAEDTQGIPALPATDQLLDQPSNQGNFQAAIQDVPMNSESVVAPAAPLSVEPARTAPNRQNIVTAAPLLPETAISGSMIGVSLGLFGLAIILSAVRRVRQATIQLNSQQIMGQLAPFVAASAYLQQRTSTSTEAMGDQIDQLRHATDTLWSE